MSAQELRAIMNSPGMWLCASVMMVIVIAEAFLLFRLSKKRGADVLTPEQIDQSIKSACYTAIGPSFAMLIICISMIALYGAPTTWMRLNDVGAPRTELAVAEIAKSAIDAGALDPATKAVKEFCFGLWGMALNNVGWFVTCLLFTKRMGSVVAKLNGHRKALVSVLMGAAGLGLYGSQLSLNVIGKTRYHVVAAVVAGVVIIFMDKLLGKYKTLQELSMGIALFIGIFAAEFARSLF